MSKFSGNKGRSMEVNNTSKEMRKSMKMKKMVGMIVLCVMLTGCNNVFAETEYDSAEKIALEADKYAKVDSVFNPIDGGYSFTVAEFDGRQTLWKDTFAEAQSVEINLSFVLAGGKAKLVHIDANDNVTTVIECTPDTSTEEAVTKTVSMSSGQNRLKFVGYDCEDVELEMLISTES